VKTDEAAPAGAEEHRGFLHREWRGRTFGPADEEPYRRRPSDWVKLVIALGILVGLAFHEGDLSNTERDIAQFFNGLPDDLESFFRVIYGLGALWAIGVVVAAALVGRRWKLAINLAIAGGVTWVVARVIGVLVVSGESVGKTLDLVVRLGDDTPAFPAVRVAVVVAVIAAAAPFLTRPTRRLGQLLVFLMAIGALYLGTSLPNGIFAGIALGWGVAAAVHLGFGSPGGRPTRAQVKAALAELGVAVDEVDLTPTQSTGSTSMVARVDGTELHIRVLGRDEADAQFLSKAWRFLLYKDGGPRLHLTRIEDVEHEGYTLLLAQRAGVRAPDVVVTGSAGPNAALLVEHRPEGTRAIDASDGALTDAVLDDLWDQVRRLHAGNVAHGSLNTRHILLGDDGAVLVDFENASTADRLRASADVAELLVSTAAVVGVDRAVASAMRGAGRDEVVRALPFLQPAALSSEMHPHRRRARKEQKELIDQVRTAAAAAAGTEEPQLQQLYRVDATNLLMSIGTLIAVYALLSQIGDPEDFWNTIKNADWGWLAVALVISFLTNYATTFSLMGCVPITLPLNRTAELQLSMSFSNLAVPAVGGLAAQVRFLQKQGLDLASAVAAGGLLSNVGMIAAQVLLFFVALALSPTAIHTGQIPTDSIAAVVAIIVLVAALAVGLTLGVPKIRDAVMPPVKSAMSTIWEALRSPRRLALLFGGNFLNALMYAAVLDACIVAFGGDVNYWTVLALNILIGTIASLIPIPGGGTAVGAVGMTGALTAVGVSTDVAVAAVLANQLVGSFIPALPGWFATRNLMNDGYL
jgi:undecaprenyl-diphosphatase